MTGGSDSRNDTFLLCLGDSITQGLLSVRPSFSVVLDSMDKVDMLDYDIEKNEFNITCQVECKYQLEILRGI